VASGVVAMGRSGVAGPHPPRRKAECLRYVVRKSCEGRRRCGAASFCESGVACGCSFVTTWSSMRSQTRLY
jgi:hypothetical protein